MLYISFKRWRGGLPRFVFIIICLLQNSFGIEFILFLTSLSHSLTCLRIPKYFGSVFYVGDVVVNARYRLTNENGLELSFLATTTKPTPINLANHCYFNLGKPIFQDYLYLIKRIFFTSLIHSYLYQFSLYSWSRECTRGTL